MILLICLTNYLFSQTKKILIIGIDGFRVDAFESASTPNIDLLIDKGFYNDQNDVYNKTKSGPSWTTILTGVYHEKHKVIDNKFKNNNIEAYPHFFDLLPGESSQKASISHWKPINKNITCCSKHISSPTSGNMVTEEAINLLSVDSIKAFFLHYDEVDITGHLHKYHPESKKYVRSISKTDSLVGIVLNTIESRANSKNEEWFVILTSDHGGDKRNHKASKNPHIRYTLQIAHVFNPSSEYLVNRDMMNNVNILPSIFNYFDILPPNYFDGKSFLETISMSKN